MEVSFLPNIFPRSIAPDLVLIIIIIWLREENFEKFWPWVIVAGFLLDILSFSRIGISSFSFLIIFFGVSFLSKRFFVMQKKKVFLASLAIVLGATTAHYFLTNILFFVPNNFSIESLSLWKVFNLQTFLFKILNNAITLGIIFWPLSKLKNIFQTEESRLALR